MRRDRARIWAEAAKEALAVDPQDVEPIVAETLETLRRLMSKRPRLRLIRSLGDSTNTPPALEEK